MRLNPKPLKSVDGRVTNYRLQFRHPKTKQVTSFSLSTADENEARVICNDVVALFQDESLLADVDSPRLVAYHRRAVEIVLGKAAGASADRKHEKPVLDESEIGRFIMRALDVTVANSKNFSNATALKVSLREPLIEILKKFESIRYAQLYKQFQSLEHQVKALRPMQEDYERLRRQLNKHIDVAFAAAVREWKGVYKIGHSPITYREACTAVDAFQESLPDRIALGEVRANHIDAWIANLSRQRANGGEESAPISPLTRKQRRAYLSVFFTWATRRYDLSENPIERTAPISGVARNPENIQAFRRLKDLQQFFRILSRYPYWKAWCAVALLAGPRWGEQRWMKIEDVYIAEGYIRIASRSSGKQLQGTKTGRERNIPIEQTVLLPVLKEHLRRRKKEQHLPDATTAQKSEWLFPSTVPENIFKPREKSQPGQWSHNRCFLNAWQRVVDELFDGPGKQAPYLKFGPSEWRHSFGTLLGHCGWSSLEIARAMGNSPDVAERHYIAVLKGGERWPFNFHGGEKN